MHFSSGSRKSEELIVVNGRYFFWIYQNKLSDENEKIHTQEWDDNDDGAPHFCHFLGMNASTRWLG